MISELLEIIREKGTCFFWISDGIHMKEMREENREKREKLKLNPKWLPEEETSPSREANDTKYITSLGRLYDQESINWDALIWDMDFNILSNSPHYKEKLMVRRIEKVKASTKQGLDA